MAVPATAQTDGSIELAADGAVLTGTPLAVTVEVVPPAGADTVEVTFAADGVPLAVGRSDGEPRTALALGTGSHSVRLDADLGGGRHTLSASAGDLAAEIEVRAIPGWLSVLPPVIAIGLALLFKDVLLSLVLGIFSGALILAWGNPFVAFARTVDSFIVPSLADSSHASILIFTTLLGGMVGLIGRSGGTRGIVERLLPYATSSRRGQLATWTLGVLIFFDDYSNTLIVGSTMRPITDRLKISREKLAYIVDSTAAPVASLVPISSWIGFEIGLIGAAFVDVGLDYNAYTTFVATIPYRFYPIFALVLGFTIAASGRDFGPMRAAERRAATTGALVRDGDTPLADYEGDQLEPPQGAPLRASNAMLPIGMVIAMTMLGLWLTGSGATSEPGASMLERTRDVLAASDSYRALLWASFSGVALAMILPLAQRILTVRQATGALLGGFKAMLLALVVLVLAWSIGAVCSELHTADYLVQIASGVLSPQWLPVLTFVLSAAVAFATGTSWGTMAILVPLVIPIADGLNRTAGLTPDDRVYYVVLLGTISSVLAGSVWGDHCSPISDTTILSSTASGCDHIAHVRTQIPYALSVGVLGMVIGDLPTAYGLSPWISLGVGSAVIVAAVLVLGRRTAPGD